MSINLKLKINDDKHARSEIVKLYYIASHKELVKWSIAIANNIIFKVEMDADTLKKVSLAFKIVKQWLNDENSVYNVRQASLKIHRLAKYNDDIIIQTILRSVGHAIGSAHMQEHAMVASDYAIKAIGLLFNNSDVEIARNRLWQLRELENIIIIN